MPRSRGLRRFDPSVRGLGLLVKRTRHSAIEAGMIRPWRRVALLLGLTAFGTALPAAAHPHIFIEEHVEVLFDQDNATGVRMTWSFDELYSSMLRSDYTDTKKGPITAKDVRNLHEKAFNNLASVHYFTTMSLDGKPVTLGVPKDFTASFNADDKAIYSFVIPLTLPKATAKSLLEIAVFDPEYYVDFELASDDPVKSSGGEALKADCQPGTIQRDTQGWGTVDADIVSCSYQGGAS
jgi:ABC-type uncharacterized transport system substrate-binding protein